MSFPGGPGAITEQSELPAHVVLYDGECGFCDKAVQWILEADAERAFHFAPLQGPTARAIIARHPGLPTDIDTVMYVRQDAGEERVFVRSTAALAVAGQLGGAYRLFAPFWLMPAFLRDLAYKAVAAVRYRIWGRLDACRLPTPGERARFLD